MYRKYNNHHLLEVNCGFNFYDESSWDSTYYGQFYELIKSEGFNEKIERKGVQVTVKDDKASASAKIASQEIEDQVIFKNNSKGLAIIIAKNKLSFHSIENYTNWQNFTTTFVLPMLEKYLNLGLGKGNFRVNCLYLNRFIIEEKERTSKYLSFVNDITKFEDLSELDNNFRRIFKLNDSTNLLVRGYRSNNDHLSSTNVLYLECGSIIESQDLKIQNVETVLTKVHASVRDLFENCITESLKNTL